MGEGQESTNRFGHHIITVSSTMAGVCLGLITLFKVTETGANSFCDEVLSIASCIFMISCLLSYLAIRRGHSSRLENLAEILMFSALLIMILVGMMMVFTRY